MLNKEKPVEIRVDRTKCTRCGICLETCPDYLRPDVDGYPAAKPLAESLFGCIQCGRCMMKCPSGAIEVRGEDCDASRLRPMPSTLPDFESVRALLLKRRSIRRFKPDPVPRETIDRILAAAATAPVGLPPSEVKVLVFLGRDKVRALAAELSGEMTRLSRMLNPVVLGLMKLFMGGPRFRMIRDFVLPLFKATPKEREKGRDILFYDAPAALFFYGAELSGKEDAIIAAATAVFAAEAADLGTCFIGTAPHLFNGSSALKKKYGLLPGEKIAAALILGLPDEACLKTFQRNFKAIRIVD